ncbi:type III-B CRISPR module RAMP protein Cmr4 [Lyngbya sp. CCAP 1446/10]|uniref:RAMP superfamily CRISPR-associated protein n=1 Tax=Lyngbya sp. CCAP 1446/10 TaxID=439293 RepID=UPI002237FF38|nr:RAMP superfamily CRISPR-associated protein [Lyngbya sp. CCAP 1446/10]MCW6051357.1 type III-B CRISPR module RAMP protein Cmr4 [Lyngbya sp. CCAP 1446/10]
MYHKAYGIIETLAPLHVGATAGEETGNLNLIFRDQFTQTGIIPGSSIRGRFRADMRSSQNGQVAKWYGHEAIPGEKDGGTTEASVKFEYASLVWLPVFCPGQPIVWVSCPSLLKRYKQIAQKTANLPAPYTAAPNLQARVVPGTTEKVLFFNLGFLGIEHHESLAAWIPPGTDLDPKQLVVVDDNDISMLHDMALYRQSRIKMLDDMKKVDTKTGAFFNVEALPVGSVLVFPLASKQVGWQPFGEQEANQPYSQELYFGGLESIGFGRCNVTLSGEALSQPETT